MSIVGHKIASIGDFITENGFSLRALKANHFTLDQEMQRVVWRHKSK